jgi:hypothetical protein
MGKHNWSKFRIKTGNLPNGMWNFSVGLFHHTDETYLHINFFRWSINIGHIYEDWV